MPRSKRVPSYCLHKATGQAVVRINGKDIYLGAHGSDASHQSYARAIAQWRAGRDAQPVPLGQGKPRSSDLTTNEALLAYLRFAESYYVKDGKTTKEFVEMKLALRPVRRLFGAQLLHEFGPTALKAVRQHMVDEQELCRNVVNHRIN